MKITSNLDSSVPDKRGRTKYMWRCELCGRCLCSKRSYMEHKNTHIAARPFKCEYCNYAAASQMTLRRHTLRQHIPRCQWHYPCPYCDQAFVEPTSYQAHLRHKHSGCSGTYGCDLCEYKTLSYKNFADHHLAKHVDAGVSQSAQTGISNFINDKRYLNKHLIEDELGVGWSQRPAQVTVGQQLASLHRLSVLEERRRKAEHLRRGKVTGLASGTHRTGYDQYGICVFKTDKELTNGNRTRNDKDDSHSNGLCNDSVYHHSSAKSSSSLYDQSCIVPEAEFYVEVETAWESQDASCSVAAKYDEDSSSVSSSSSDRGSDNEDDNDEEDSLSCSNESGTLEVNSRLTALTGEIEEVRNAISIGEEDNACRDLGNDMLPDGQVDFDLD